MNVSGTASCACTDEYTGPACEFCASGYQDRDGDGLCNPACGSPGVCTGMPGCDDRTGTAVCDVCPLTSGATLAWQINAPTRAFWDTPAAVVYAADNRSSLGSFPWTRVAYCLLLDTNYVYVEMDDYTSHTLSRVDVPTDWIYDQPVASLTVRSNVAAAPVATAVSTGYIEMWSNCYSTSPNSVYDYDDSPNGATDCYGSFQVHNGTTTALAWNGFGLSAGTWSFGIGNQTASPSVGADWTSAANAGSYSVRRVTAYLVP